VPKWRQIWQESEPWGDIVYHQAADRFRRYKAGEKLDDFFSCLMDDNDGNPNSLEFGEIVAETGAIVDAGAETTAHRTYTYYRPTNSAPSILGYAQGRD
jgi:cytochrome P450